jgi:hypothetical protein
MLEREAESLRDEAMALQSQATTLDNRREQFVVDFAEPIKRLREAAGLPPTDILAPPTRPRSSM